MILYNSIYDDKFFQKRKDCSLMSYDFGSIESSGNYFLEIMLPGFEKEDINIDYNEKELIIKAERKENEKFEYYSKGSFFGKINERFKLSFEPEEIDAKYENGVLRVELKRKKKDIPKIKFN